MFGHVTDVDGSFGTLYSAPPSLFSEGGSPLQDTRLLDQLFYDRMVIFR